MRLFNIEGLEMLEDDLDVIKQDDILYFSKGNYPIISNKLNRGGIRCFYSYF